jgi:hypothetical protein
VKAVIVRDVVPLFVKPSMGAELADEALFGMTLEVVKEAGNGFYYVRTPYRYEGYAPGMGLMADSTMLERWEAMPKLTVWAPYLDVKSAPDVKAPTIISCPRGSLLGRMEEGAPLSEGYIPIALPDGHSGYVRRACVAPQITGWSKDNEIAIRKKLVSTAKLYLGTQYRWGGKTPIGIDCSGLTSMSYMLNGSIIYRDADIRPGFDMHEIAFESKQAGDLIFFKGHVAMYMGDNLFIHCTAYAKAVGTVVNSFDPNSPIYRGDLLEAVIKTGSIF